MTTAAGASRLAAHQGTGVGPQGSKAAPEPDAKDDLKSLPVPEVEKRLSSSPDGLVTDRPHPG